MGTVCGGPRDLTKFERHLSHPSSSPIDTGLRHGGWRSCSHSCTNGVSNGRFTVAKGLASQEVLVGECGVQDGRRPLQ